MPERAAADRESVLEGCLRERMWKVASEPERPKSLSMIPVGVPGLFPLQDSAFNLKLYLRLYVSLYEKP